ncbi:DUF998 domain-containing protein [Streptoverticillium reticulum]|uniref:DUF998 domain-containing protein n=1 Tax=Streptoverticillium reticulum TaxID=1433415 RepID=UPI0039BFE4A6
MAGRRPATADRVSSGVVREHRAVSLTAARLLVAAAGLYLLWSLEFGLGTRLNYDHSFASELFAADQPYRWFFGTADALAGAAAAAAGLLMLRARASSVGHGAWELVGWAAVTVFGVVTIADVAVFPLDCAPSANPGCRAAELAGIVSFRHQAHAYTSSVANASLLTAMGTLARAARHRGPAWWFRWGVSLFAAELLSMAMTLVLLPSAEWFGVPQRIGVVIAAVWLLTVAWVQRGPGARRTTPEKHPVCPGQACDDLGVGAVVTASEPGRNPATGP